MGDTPRIVFAINEAALNPAPVDDSGQINGLAPMRVPANYMKNETGGLVEFPTFEQAAVFARSNGLDERHVEQVLIQTLVPNREPQ